jgi:hypothetical protein
VGKRRNELCRSSTLALLLSLACCACKGAEAAAAADKGIWPGATGRSGVNGDPVLDRASIEAFGAWRGRPCSVAHTYTERSNWEKMTRGSGWVFDNFAGFPGLLVISQGLVPEGHQADLPACASGAHDDDWRAFGALMVETNRAASVVRLGWEFNGTFMPWFASDPKLWKACYRHAALAIRAANPKVILDWTVNSHATPTSVCGGAATGCYPGDDVVDIIGIDNYDMSPSAKSAEDFKRIADGPEGLNRIFAFAKRHHKKFSVGEWGVAPGSELNSTGENPEFIRWMHSWFAAHASDIAYEAYFNSCGAGVQSNLHLPVGPKCPRRNSAAAELYRSLFGSH